jgi:hypothetical protein
METAKVEKVIRKSKKLTSTSLWQIASAAALFSLNREPIVMIYREIRNRILYLIPLAIL